MFFFKIAEAIISSQELTNSDLENLCDSSEDSLDLNDSELEQSELLNVLREDNERQNRKKIFHKGLLFNLLSCRNNDKTRQSLYRMSKLISSKKFTDISSTYYQRTLGKRNNSFSEDFKTKINEERRSKLLRRSEIMNNKGNSNCQKSTQDLLIPTDVYEILQRISSYLDSNQGSSLELGSNIEDNLIRIRSNLFSLKDKLLSSTITSKLSTRDLLILTKYVRSNIRNLSGFSDNNNTNQNSEELEDQDEIKIFNNNNNSNNDRGSQDYPEINNNETQESNKIGFKKEDDSKLILVQLAKKTAQPIQARINEFLKNIVDFVSKNYQSIKITADGLNNNVNRSENSDRREDWIPILKVTWHRLLALSMAEQGTDPVIVNQIHEIIPSSTPISRGHSMENLTGFTKEKDQAKDPLSELFSTYSSFESSSEEKIPNRFFADRLLACLRDLQSVSLQTQEYLLIRHAILFTAFEPSYLPSFALNLIKAVRAIRNCPLDSETLITSLNTLVVLCPKQIAALFCDHLVKRHTKVDNTSQLTSDNNNSPTKFDSHLDYLLHTESFSPSTNHAKPNDTSELYNHCQIHKAAERIESHQHFLNNYDCDCLCDKKVSILSTVLNKKNNAQTTKKSKLLLSPSQT